MRHVSMCSMLSPLLCVHVFTWSVHLTNHPLRNETKNRKQQKSATRTRTSNASGHFLYMYPWLCRTFPGLHCTHANICTSQLKICWHNYTFNLFLFVFVVKKGRRTCTAYKVVVYVFLLVKLCGRKYMCMYVCISLLVHTFMEKMEILFF